MPNGRPGDHPIYDITHHGLEVFGAPIDGLIREIDAIIPREDRDLLDLIVMFWPKDGSWRPLKPQDLAYVLEGLLRRYKR